MFSTMMIVSRDQGKGFADKYYATEPVSDETPSNTVRALSMLAWPAHLMTILLNRSHS